jgi:hypothetical protein
MKHYEDLAKAEQLAYRWYMITGDMFDCDALTQDELDVLAAWAVN